MTRPCLVYVAGPRGPEPQIWYEPMVTPAGVIAVRPEGLVIVSEPIPLAPDFAGTIEDAVKLTLEKDQ